MTAVYLGDKTLVLALDGTCLELEPGAKVEGEVAEKLLTSHPKLFRLVGEGGAILKEVAPGVY